MVARGGWRRERALAGDPERRPRGRSDDAVDAQAVTGLQAAHGGLGFRSEVAVGGEAERPLQTRDPARAFGFARRGRRGAPARGSAGAPVAAVMGPFRGGRSEGFALLDAEHAP